MKKKELLNKYFNLVEQEGICASQRNLRFYLNYIFKNVSFDNKTMLDIGGGNGLFSFYAACMGCNEVILLEPEAAGSGSGVIEKFNKFRLLLGIPDKIKFASNTFQEFNFNDKKIDIFLLHDSINHLDEEACINLQHDSRAKEIYKTLFQKLVNLANDGAKFIITDCSRYNFFPLFNLKNFFAPTIEWHKHQSPGFWAKMLSDVGLCNPKIRWTTTSKLRLPGRLLLGNKFATYFMRSHFCLTMEKK